MFDGSFKAKRTINLGGNKQQVDKQKLLRQAQEERRLREAERLRLKSAERIQVMAFSLACLVSLWLRVDKNGAYLQASNLNIVYTFLRRPGIAEEQLQEQYDRICARLGIWKPLLSKNLSSLVAYL